MIMGQTVHIYQNKKTIIIYLLVVFTYLSW